MYIDYKEADVHNYQLLDILRGRKMSMFNQFRQLNTDKNSRIIIIVTSHGGENFIKVRGKLVILSDELNRTLNEMYIKQRYKEIVFVLDTCEGYSLFDNVNVPNVYFVASALLNQKASSYSFDGNLMGPTADKFHFLLWRKLTEISKNQNYDMKMDTLFEEIKEKKDFLTTDVTILNKIDRNLTIGEFFGDSRVDNHEIETYGNITLDFDEEAASNSFDFNLKMLNHKKEMNKGVMEIKQYKEDHYTLQENKENSKGKLILGAFGVVVSVNILIALFI